MTGSGKTGLGIGLLEEALIDNIPVIAIDPKGDLEELEEISIKPKSTGITLEVFGLTWMPFRKNAGGGLNAE